MYRLQIHKDAQKALAKAPRKTQEKFLQLAQHLSHKGTVDCPYAVNPMKGKYQIYREVKIESDYRIVLRIEENTIYIRYAGTHNSLGTG